MNIFIEIGHPAHVHKLAGTIKILKDHHHKIVVVTKEITSIKFLYQNWIFLTLSLGLKKIV
jgi:predicted glycosyltransferase